MCLNGAKVLHFSSKTMAELNLRCYRLRLAGISNALASCVCGVIGE
jgi:hypothetical protein